MSLCSWTAVAICFDLERWPALLWNAQWDRWEQTWNNSITPARWQPFGFFFRRNDETMSLSAIWKAHTIDFLGWRSTAGLHPIHGDLLHTWKKKKKQSYRNHTRHCVMQANHARLFWPVSLHHRGGCKKNENKFSIVPEKGPFEAKLVI